LNQRQRLFEKHKTDREKDQRFSGKNAKIAGRWSSVDWNDAKFINRDTYSEEDSFSVEHGINAYGDLVFELRYYDKHYNDVTKILESLESNGFPPFTYRTTSGGEVSRISPYSPEFRSIKLFLNFGNFEESSISIAKIKEIFSHIKTQAELYFDPIWFGGQIYTKKYKL